MREDVYKHIGELILSGQLEFKEIFSYVSPKVLAKDCGYDLDIFEQKLLNLHLMTLNDMKCIGDVLHVPFKNFLPYIWEAREKQVSWTIRII